MNQDKRTLSGRVAQRPTDEEEENVVPTSAANLQAVIEEVGDAVTDHNSVSPSKFRPNRVKNRLTFLFQKHGGREGVARIWPARLARQLNVSTGLAETISAILRGNDGNGTKAHYREIN